MTIPTEVAAVLAEMRTLNVPNWPAGRILGDLADRIESALAASAEPVAWFKSVFTPAGPHSPEEYDIALDWGRNPPDGAGGWSPLYTHAKPAARAQVVVPEGLAVAIINAASEYENPRIPFRSQDRAKHAQQVKLLRDFAATLIEEPAPIPQSLTAGGDGGEAAGYVNTDGTVTWYTENFGTISRKPKPGTDVYTRPSPVADAEALLREVCQELVCVGCDPCTGSDAPMEDLHGRIADYFARRLKDPAHD